MYRDVCIAIRRRRWQQKAASIHKTEGGSAEKHTGAHTIRGLNYLSLELLRHRVVALALCLQQLVVFGCRDEPPPQLLRVSLGWRASPSHSALMCRSSPLPEIYASACLLLLLPKFDPPDLSSNSRML